MSDHTAIEFQRIPNGSWSEALRMAEKGEVEVISGDLADKTIQKTHHFTQAYLERQLSVVMSKNKSSFSSIYQIADKKIAIIKGYGYTWEVFQKYPEISFIEVENIQQGLSGLASGEYDAFIATDLVINYHIAHLNLKNLSIVGQLPVTMKIGFAVRKDKPELLSILNKGLAQISSREKYELIEQWMQQHYSVGIDKEKIGKIALLATVIVLISLLWAGYNRQQKKIAQRAEKHYQELNQRFLLATEAASLGIWEWKRDDRDEIIFNLRMYEIYGLPEETIIFAKIWMDSIHPEDQATVQKSVTQLSTTGNNQTVEYRVMQPDGEIRHLLSSSTLVKGIKGEPDKVFGTTWDITKRKQSEVAIRQLSHAAEAANRTKSRFLANMSHEIRTPMNAVMGLAHLALQANPRPQVKEYLSKIQTSSSVLLGIINDILDFSKIEAGKLTLDNTAFNMKTIFDRLDSLTTVETDHKGLQRRLIIDPTIPHWLMGDPLRIGQVLLNLTHNAIKFTATGSVTTEVKLESCHDENVTLRFSVKDTGIGIGKEGLVKLFDAFEQAEDSTSRRFGGTGLGLSISKHLVEKMGGKISVLSKEGKGSEFFFTLEFIKAYAPKTEPLNNPTTQHPLHGTLLVVEDNYINQEVAKGLLENMGLTIQIANNGQEGVEAVRAGNFDVVLMDIQMPIMDGLEACKIIRKQYDATTLPVIAMTADAMVEDEARSLAAGMNAHLSKPIDPDLLYKTLLQFLPSEDENTTITHIAGVNLEQALKHLAGNTDLLMRLLQQFEKSHADDVTTLRRLLNQGDSATAKKLIHTLKGVAGNLGIEKLHQAAKELESEMNENNLQQLEALLAEVILGIRSVLIT